jgi:acyl carrier protein
MVIQFKILCGGINMNSEDIMGKLLIFFQNFILYNESMDEINGDESLIDKGYIDSTGLISLVAFIEETFNFKIYDREIIPENFESINKIHMYINNRVMA